MNIRAISECACDLCKNMCKNSPCLGTPDDIQKIMDAGYKDRLRFTIWFDQGNTDCPRPTIAPINGPNGCVFQDDQGLCELHDLGLKPTEGKLAIHNQNDNGLRRTVGYTWISQEGISTFERFGLPEIEELKKIISEAIPFVKQGKMIKIG